MEYENTLASTITQNRGEGFLTENSLNLLIGKGGSPLFTQDLKKKICLSEPDNDTVELSVLANSEEKLKKWQLAIIKQFDNGGFDSEGIKNISFDDANIWDITIPLSKSFNFDKEITPYKFKKEVYKNTINLCRCKVDNEEVTASKSKMGFWTKDTKTDKGGGKGDDNKRIKWNYVESIDYISDNDYLIAYYLNTDKKNKFPTYKEIVTTQGIVKEFGLLFYNESEDIIRVVRFAPKTDKYFVPLIKEYTDPNVSYKYLKFTLGGIESKDEEANADVVQSHYVIPLGEISSSVWRNRAFAWYTSEKPEAYISNGLWADYADTNGKITRSGAFNNYVHYNVTLFDKNNSIIDEIKTSSLSFLNIKSNGYKNILNVKNSDIEGSLAGKELKAGSELYKVQGNFKQPAIYDKQNKKFNGHKIADDEKLKTYQLSKSGVEKLASFKTSNDHFYVIDNGIICYGYEHRRSKGIEDIWDKMYTVLTSPNGPAKIVNKHYTIKEINKDTNINKVGDYQLFSNGNIVSETNEDITDGIIKVSKDLVRSTFEKDTKQEVYTAFEKTFAKWSGMDRGSTYIDLFMYRWYNNKENPIRKNITQEQYDAILIMACLGVNFDGVKYDNFDNFCKSIKNIIPSANVADDVKAFINDSKVLFNVKTSEEKEKRTAEKVYSIKISCVANTSIDVLKTVEKDLLKNWWFAVPNYNEDDCLFYISSKTKDVENVELTPSAAKIAFGEELEFINFWTVKNERDNTDGEGKKKQYLCDASRYYDFYSGMTPYVEVSFRGKETENGYSWNKIDSVNYPYIKSLNVEDSGVKTIELVLYDKDFASYQHDKILGTYSLETLIKQALITNNNAPKEGENNEDSYTELAEDETTLKEDYIKFSEYNEKMTSAENLKIRFGYCDYNQPIYKNEEVVDDKLKKAESAKGSNGRTHRWFDVTRNDPSQNYNLTANFNLENTTLTEGKTMTLANVTEEIVAVDGKQPNVSDAAKNKSADMTTVLSYVVSYVIIGYSSTLKTNGIEYHIKAVESNTAALYKKRFLQRYAEMTSYPLEVLYNLMRMLNKNNDEVIPASTPKLLLLNDMKGQATDGFNMLIDTSGMDKTEAATYVDLNTYDGKKETKDIDPTILKKISIRFGGEEALRNYLKTSDKPPLYKSVASLIDEFCAACPPRRIQRTRAESSDSKDEQKFYDKDGNEIIKEDNSILAPLKWFTARKSIKDKDGNYVGIDEKDDNVYIILYYREPVKLTNIREYNWGPGNPYKTVVKNINIQNNNEFAVFAGVTSFKQGGDGITKQNVTNKDNTGKNNNYTATLDSDKIAKEMESDKSYPSDFIAENTVDAAAYEKAYNGSMYTGTIEILGDPGMQFSTLLQPYTYPIRLNVLLPINEYELKNRNSDEINDVEKIYGKKTITGYSKYHETSRYYVITKISHSISASGFKTTLEVASYPNIEYDILLSPAIEKRGSMY